MLSNEELHQRYKELEYRIQKLEQFNTGLETRMMEKLENNLRHDR
jgi:hypothetical protein